MTLKEFLEQAAKRAEQEGLGKHVHWSPLKRNRALVVWQPKP
jgi:hypothetical protein